MASLVGKKKGNQTYYYAVTTGRVNGKSRVVKQTYLGTAERLEKLVQDKAVPVPLQVSALDLGLSGTLWQAADRSGPLTPCSSSGQNPAPDPPGPLLAARRNSLHFCPRAQNHRRRLVSALHPAPAVGLPLPVLPLARLFWGVT